ncbi:hypothetical protein P872_18990 [Rhodonellum psychrophilum GCM71 = DSM 17998]|uniref:Prokaryotic-type class I peptide chain release factors domain-containing protein n=2 Tax=Rhodonellum TaxID=336827 RepID=U5C024_9BACT|nr:MULTISPECIES: alternative ribosome rescue aminoacyl-tRNA hydrolase ArfB [Rhodonellum]ERM82271.1 hypothetical protein P872_18990 [Rhodonellum psychrophilum GCM71 = DSM 17998]SDZ25532.1 ribosome-associated protein [Rhodonellum ikkaensis]
MHILKKIAERVFDPELEFKATRSSGPGGQNVNKVNTKVSLRFDIHNSEFLVDRERQVLLTKYASKVTTEGVLIIDAQETRSQLQNKELAIQKFYELLSKAFKPKKIRLKTKPGKGAVQKRLNEKKAHGEKKANRRRLE